MPTRRITHGMSAAVSAALGVLVAMVVNLLTAGQRSLPLVIGGAVIFVSLVVIEWWRAHTPAEAGNNQLPTIALESNLVERPELITDAIDWVLSAGQGRLGITTALQGSGGFGKTTLATMIANSRRVQERFSGRQIMLSIGQELAGPTLARRISDVIYNISGEPWEFSDPDQAGQKLGQVLDQGPPWLLIVDDIWRPDQLKPFLVGGRNCPRIITTRIASVLPENVRRLNVDELTDQQAQSIIVSGLPELPLDVVNKLVRYTFHWALLVQATNRALRAAHKNNENVVQAAQQAIKQFEALGPSALDGNIQQARERAVRATVAVARDS